MRETSWDFGARVNVYYGKLSFGAGVGMEFQRYPNTMSSATRPLLDAHAAYTFGTALHTNAQLLVIGTGAFGSDNTNGPECDIISVRAALGLHI